MPADVVSLAEARARRTKPVAQAYLFAQPNRVVLQFSKGEELGLSPANARLWAERLAAMADVAEGLDRDQRGDR